MPLRAWRVLASVFVATLIVALSPAWACAETQQPCGQIASDIDVNVKPARRSEGTMNGALRSDGPMVSTFHGASIVSTLLIEAQVAYLMLHPAVVARLRS